MLITPPLPAEYAAYYGNYISKVNGGDLLAALEQNRYAFPLFINSIGEQKADYRYAPGKWSIKEIMVHLTDAERIFAYRVLRFARKDKTPLSGFDENSYVPESNAGSQPVTQLLHEWESVRLATITLFKSLTSETILCTGPANGKDVSVRALGYITVGHTIHHQQVIAERYL